MSETVNRFFSRSDFAKVCGIEKNGAAYIGSMINKGRLIEIPEVKKLDVFDETNAQYIRSKMGRSKKLKALYDEILVRPNIKKTVVQGNKKPVNTIKETIIIKEAAPKEPKERRETKSKSDDGLEPLMEYDGLKAWNLQDVKTIEEIKQKRARTRILELEENKVLAKMLPTEIAVSALQTFGDSMNKNFIASVKQWIMEVSHRNKLAGEEQAKLTGELIDIVNTVYDNSIELAESKMSDAIEEMTKVEQIKHDEDE